MRAVHVSSGVSSPKKELATWYLLPHSSLYHTSILSTHFDLPCQPQTAAKTMTSSASTLSTSGYLPHPLVSMGIMFTNEQKAGNIVFTAIKQWLLVNDTTFFDMFSLPVESGSIPEGTVRQKPIMLEGTSPEDFRAFLLLLHGEKYVF